MSLLRLIFAINEYEFQYLDSTKEIEPKLSPTSSPPLFHSSSTPSSTPASSRFPTPSSTHWSPPLIDVWNNYSMFMLEVTILQFFFSVLSFFFLLLLFLFFLSLLFLLFFLFFSSFSSSSYTLFSPVRRKRIKSERYVFQLLPSVQIMVKKYTQVDIPFHSLLLLLLFLFFLLLIPSSYTVADEGVFKRNFGVFTERQFDGWEEWQNMVVVGGSVVGSLLPLPNEYSNNEADYFHNVCSHSLLYSYILSLTLTLILSPSSTPSHSLHPATLPLSLSPF